MNDVADTFTEAGLRAQTRPRDAASVNTLEVRFTDPIAFVECLNEDGSLGAIEDGIVWLARTSGEATVAHVTERDYDHRVAPGWRAMYVECSYLARNQLHKGSFYCGVALIKSNTEEPRTMATARRLLEMERRMQAAVGKASREHKLTIRGGGAMHLFDVGSPWQAHPDQTIAAVPDLTCKHCSEAIYFSNEAWRHKSTGRTAATRQGHSTRSERPMTVWDHDAEPAEEVSA